MSDASTRVKKQFLDAMSGTPIGPLLSSCPRILVAFSGGADSAALLSLLSEFCGERSIPLLAVHVHHGIRGAEADRDAEAAEAFCREREIPFRLQRVDVPAFAEEQGLGLEEAARILRYRVLLQIAEEVPGTLIATAHSADDHLETVLFRLLRGTALSGLCGIPAHRDGIIRPLLSCTAEEIRNYCRLAGIPFLEDSTNGDLAYARNYIRWEIVPRLSKISKDPAASVLRMCAALRADAAYLDGATRDALGSYADKTAAPLSLLRDLPEALLSRAILLLYENAAHSRKDVTFGQVETVSRLIEKGGYGRCSLPCRVTASVAAGWLSMLPEDGRKLPKEDFVAELPLGETLFVPFGFGVRLEKGGEKSEKTAEEGEECENIYKLSIRRSIPFATIRGTVRMRFRQPGDTIRQGGMTRRVKKLLNEAKIPPKERAFLPVFTDDEGIFWIPGLPVRDGADGDGEVLTVTYFHL